MDRFPDDKPSEYAHVVAEPQASSPVAQQSMDGDVYNPEPDVRDMRRLGRRQEVKRRFRFFSIIGYMIILASTWEAALVTTILSLPNGGTAGTIWMTVIQACGMFFATLSLAEMASISPTAGGQYHWVSEFAPPSLQKPLSYAVGWMSALGWQTAMPAVAYVAGTQIISLISLVDTTYIAQNWHSALLTIAFVVFAILFNMFAINKMPLVEGLVVIIHVFGFFAFIVILWVMGPRTPGSETFTTFADEYGWGNSGVAMLVAVVGPASALIGADAAVHLAEELQDASYVLPRAMIASALINYATAFVMVVSIVSAIGPNLEAVLESSTGQPWVEIIRLATGSDTATIVLLVLVCFLFTFTSVNQITTSSRQLWALARDKGVPFHKFLSKVSTPFSPIRNFAHSSALTSHRSSHATTSLRTPSS